LGGDAEFAVVGDLHPVRGIPPAGDLLLVDAEVGGAVGVAHGEVGGAAQVPGRHQVGVHVVVHQRGVLVRAGDPVDPEASVGVVMAHRAPQPRGGDRHLQTGALFELPVLRRPQVAVHGVGDVGVDVQRRGSGGPVTGALLTTDGPPGKRDATKSEFSGAGLGEVHRRMTPKQGVPDHVGRQVVLRN